MSFCDLRVDEAEDAHAEDHEDDARERIETRERDHDEAVSASRRRTAYGT